MYIHEAIEKAGEGGKIRRPDFVRGGYVISHAAGARYYWHDGGRVDDWIPCKDNLTADDWEVVEPELKIGDTVIDNDSLNYKDNPSEWGTLAAIHPTNGEYLIIWGDGSWGTYKDIAFISRPEKKVHTFEGVEFHAATMGTVITTKSPRLVRDLPHAPNGYRMTLEEM